MLVVHSPMPKREKQPTSNYDHKRRAHHKEYRNETESSAPQSRNIGIGLRALRKERLLQRVPRRVHYLSHLKHHKVIASLSGA